MPEGSTDLSFRDRLRAAGIDDDKPLYVILSSVHDAMVATQEAVSGRARGLTPEAEADLVTRLAKTAEDVTRNIAGGYRFAIDRRTSLIAGAVVAASLAVGIVSGYWWGWSVGYDRSVRIEDGLSAAYRYNGSAGAEAWLGLMVNNDPIRALQHCSGSAVWSDGGRKACSVPLWVDGPGSPEAKQK